MKPKGRYKFTYLGTEVFFETEKNDPQLNSPKAQRIIKRFLKSSVPAAKNFFKSAKFGHHFCIIKQKLGFENEIILE